MHISAINNTSGNYNTRMSFGAFKIRNNLEMNNAKKILKKNCPGYWNNLVSNCENILGNTNYFDGLLDIEYGQLVMRLVHSKNFDWPNKKISIVSFSDKSYTPRLLFLDDAIEFMSNNGEELRLKKFDENERKVTYTVKNWIGSRMWSDKASVEQAKLVKELDVCISKAAGDVVYDEGTPIAYNPIP